jgi:hypothetical protein
MTGGGGGAHPHLFSRLGSATIGDAPLFRRRPELILAPVRSHGSARGSGKRSKQCFQRLPETVLLAASMPRRYDKIKPLSTFNLAECRQYG